MKDTNYITIIGWMVNKLGLSGNDLLVYAVIYGFSQDKKSVFKGSLSYLSGCLNVSKRAVIDILNRLVIKGMIIKKEYTKNGQKYCEYRTPKDQNPQTGLPEGGEDSSPGGGEKPPPEVAKNPPPGGGEEPPPGGGEEFSPGGGEKPPPGRGEESSPGGGEKPPPGGGEESSPGGGEESSPGW
jgi:predicted transcriptional regulator